MENKTVVEKRHRNESETEKSIATDEDGVKIISVLENKPVKYF